MSRLSYCAAQVQAQDIDRFHLALCAPASAQPGLLALAAFNLELARTASRVTDANLGLIRLQWWREVLDELKAGGPVRGHQVALALQDIGDTLELPALHMMIEGREADLAEGPFLDREAMRAYLAQTSGSLLVAQGRLLGLSGHEGMANHLGCAFGFIGQARALAAGRTEGLRGLPSWESDLGEAVAELTAQATMHLDRAEELRAEAKDMKSLSPLFATAHLGRRWLSVFARTPVGHGRFLRPLPLQLLRLSWRRP